jgi:hypothetical protein
VRVRVWLKRKFGRGGEDASCNEEANLTCKVVNICRCVEKIESNERVSTIDCIAAESIYLFIYLFIIRHVSLLARHKLFF